MRRQCNAITAHHREIGDIQSMHAYCVQCQTPADRYR
jgi:hypothetical protein